jgi:hypothetical protein
MNQPPIIDGLYDELFAMRIELQDVFNDESEIIFELRQYLLTSRLIQPQYIPFYLHNFYNLFGVPISEEELNTLFQQRTVEDIFREQIT